MMLENKNSAIVLISDVDDMLMMMMIMTMMMLMVLMIMTMMMLMVMMIVMHNHGNDYSVNNSSVNFHHNDCFDLDDNDEERSS